MTRAERDELRELARRAMGVRPGVWALQTSNSFRRVGTRGDGDVLCATTHPVDRHPDLLAPPSVLEYLVAMQPKIGLELLDGLALVEVERDRLLRLLAVACDELDDTGGEYARRKAEELRREALNKEVSL
jgi:hypothetical protein